MPGEEQKPIDIKDTVFGMIPQEMQTKLYNEMLANQKKFIEQNRELSERLRRHEQALSLVQNEGLPTQLVEPIAKVAGFLHFTHVEELEVLRVKNPLEYKKRVFRQYTTVTAEKRREYDDAQLDIEGEVVYDKLKAVIDWFKERIDLQYLAPEDYDEYPKKVRELMDCLTLLVKWTKLDADLSTIDEATINLMMQMWMSEIREGAASATGKLGADYKDELEKMEETEQTREEHAQKLASLEQTVSSQGTILAQIKESLDDLRARGGAGKGEDDQGAPDDEQGADEPQEEAPVDDEGEDAKPARKPLKAPYRAVPDRKR